MQFDLKRMRRSKLTPHCSNSSPGNLNVNFVFKYKPTSGIGLFSLFILFAMLLKRSCARKECPSPNLFKLLTGQLMQSTQFHCASRKGKQTLIPQSRFFTLLHLCFSLLNTHSGLWLQTHTFSTRYRYISRFRSNLGTKLFF